jgi:hypothetical protein
MSYTFGIRWRTLAIAAVMLCANCAAFIEGCTLVGCENILTVTFSSPPDVAYHLEALSIDGGALQFDCPDPSRCQSAQLQDYAPDKLVLTVTTARGSKQYNLTPSYESVYPNGKRCGAACRTGSVTVALP